MKRFYETYIERFKVNPNNVLEIGSRDGDDAELLRDLSKLEPWKIHVVEPNPESFKNILRKYPLFNAYNLAISNRPGVVDCNATPHIYSQSIVGTSSLLSRSENVPKQPENWIKILAITGINILELINQPEIDIVKIDVEGFTYEVIQSFGDDIRLLKALHLEVEIEPLTIWKNQKHYDDVKKIMQWYGFEEKYYDGKFWQHTEIKERLQGDSIWTRID